MTIKGNCTHKLKEHTGTAVSVCLRLAHNADVWAVGAVWRKWSGMRRVGCHFRKSALLFEERIKEMIRV